MRFRSCWLTLAVFLAACSGGGSDSEPEETTSTFAPPPVIIPQTNVKPRTGSDVFKYGPEDGIIRWKVSEEPSSKSHSININGTPIKFTASAGHLVSTGSVQIGSGLAYVKADAAIFYTAYTRDGLPKENRPVTFVFNGGPGGASAPLDLDFLGPKSYDEEASEKAGAPRLKDNPNTLLDKTDLVFVDPVGTGYSAAVSPFINRDFWGVDSDAKILSSFIARFVETNNRHSSPKYIYGVSYGGLRAPIIGRLLLESGAGKSAASSPTKSENVLSGLILNSPILDKKTDCYNYYVSCHGALPTYAMVKAFHDKATEKEDFDAPIFLAAARTFAGKFKELYLDVFQSVDKKVPDRSKWEAYLNKTEAADFLNQLYQLTGIGKLYQSTDNAADNPWIANPNMNSSAFAERFDPAKGKLLLGDGRFFLDQGKVDPALDRRDVNYDYVKLYQADFINYKAQSNYLGSNGQIIGQWNFEPDQRLSLTDDRFGSTIPDLGYSMTLNPELKVLVQHGYYDLNTPFYQSEVDIQNAKLSSKISVKSYSGGHGVGPFDTDKYETVLTELKAFYDLPAVKLAALNSVLPEARKP
ncbi:carboxypeptidase C (cathepsin A) [Phyllobacterium sp. YR531]|uniref:S10 family serine carboxypeptidase-like protein n=1 Tax=Phyllobacterium sp. YR531 TaxID=1144343 RepID=UPI00026F6C62|nr:carboxypeptidase C (cathepsin A) [Phyllobacterium sp. YR531]EJN05146.1 carboxypeptidase C (cathepsin A) [Phyllobacterium sp. YR531]